MLSKTRKQKLKANIWKFYLYRVFSSLMFISPIYVLFLQDNGLSITQVMILTAAYTAVMMIAVVPAGILADYIGRKKVLLINGVFFTAAWIIYGLGTSFWHFLTAEIVIAMSSATWMAGTAFFYDTLRELGIEGTYKKRYGNVLGINYIAWGISSLVGGYIAAESLRLPFWITGIASVFALMLLFSFTDTKTYKHGDKRYFAHLKEASKFAATHPRVRLFIIYSAIIAAVGMGSYMLYQPYLESVGLPIAFFGGVYFVMSMLGAVGSKAANSIESVLGEKKTLAMLLIVSIICLIGLSNGFLVAGILFIILLNFAEGIYDTVISDYLNKHTESHHRATVMSLMALVGQMATTIMVPVFGWIVDLWSLGAAFIMMALMLAINLVILVGAFTIIHRKENGRKK